MKGYNSVKMFYHHLVTCAVFAISTVWMDTCAGVEAFCVLTSGMFITVRTQSALIHIWHTQTQKSLEGFFLSDALLIKINLLTYPDRQVDSLPTSHCCCNALWCLPAGKSHHCTDRPQSRQHGSLSPETSRSPEDEEPHRTLL